MRRRQFLKHQMAAGLWLAAGMAAPARLLAAPAVQAGPDIAVVKGKDPAANTRAAVEAMGGMAAVVKPGDKVVIKPNMSFPHAPEMGTNTHPMVIQALVGMCWEAKAASVLVLDNPFNNPERCLESSGIADACKALRDDMVFAQTSYSRFADKDTGGSEMKKTQVMKEVLDADKLIAAPTAKSHASAGVSLSIKGMMGLIYDRGVMHWRYRLDEAIADLGMLLKADLTVIDATYVLTTGGPSGPGKVLREDTVIASRDMVAADAQAVASFEWYGRKFRPDQVDHLKAAAKRGLGNLDLANQNIKTLQL